MVKIIINCDNFLFAKAFTKILFYFEYIKSWGCIRLVKGYPIIYQTKKDDQITVERYSETAFSQNKSFKISNFLGLLFPIHQLKTS